MKKQGKIHYAWWIMVASAAIYAASVGIIVSCAGLLYRAVAEDLNVGVSEISLYTSLMYLTVTILLPFAGKVLNKFDIRYILTIAGIINALAFGLMGTYNSVIPFYISGIALGIGSTFLIYGSIPLIMNNWFKVKAGTSLGIAMAFMGIGGAIFAQITGGLIESIGWRSTYMVLGIAVAILILPFSIFVIRSKPEELNMTAYGEDEVVENAPASSKMLETGVLKSAALKSPAFYLVLVFTGLFGLASTVSFHVPNFVQSVGFTAAMAATGVTCVTIGQTGGKFMLGAINDKFGIKSALFVGIGGGMLGVVALLISDSFGIGMLYAGALLFGIGFSGSTLLPPVVIREVFGGRDYASIYTTIMSASTLGVAVGTTLFSYIFDSTGSYYTVFITVIILFIIVISSSLISLNWKKKLNV
ncbi:MFS transporter [Peribacillus psychrosaccharolyticus]|uniref:MFS transporter n=1 Tax=Peribacillus psychrosaccharolyticus TaxID=1407 RepID=A0A974NPB6_PERPY|nr:MFS transporter [Peribacillus psychrosaccharolyticus]MEC2054091.1 MFS transporter [Peribacillus psychrosaccharolyticus]MED3742288.1 MFS transporter [Peribacillus psychrosaccharolyticus]QQT01268.1 MFS transporter [Peribacillus psychrosaccharolyticus]